MPLYISLIYGSDFIRYVIIAQKYRKLEVENQAAHHFRVSVRRLPKTGHLNDLIKRDQAIKQYGAQGVSGRIFISIFKFKCD
jgi:hypothetical protein